jgi:putative phage-type endonuclease
MSDNNGKYYFTEEELPQGSEEWMQFREGRFGSSEVAVLFRVSQYDDIGSLWRRRVGLEEKQKTDGMIRGNEMEPYARALYERVTGNEMEQMVLIHPDYPWMHSSLDGISKDRSVLVEIKTAKTAQNWQRFTKDNKVPDFRLPQIQQQLAVANAVFGTTKAHYWCFYDDKHYGGEGGKPIEVTIDHAYCAELMRRMEIFYNQFIVAKREPPSYLFGTEPRSTRVEVI